MCSSLSTRAANLGPVPVLRGWGGQGGPGGGQFTLIPSQGFGWPPYKRQGHCVESKVPSVNCTGHLLEAFLFKVRAGNDYQQLGVQPGINPVFNLCVVG